MRRLCGILGLAFAAASTSSSAEAAGLFTADRSARPLGRGGAFVAGADDLSAIWYNPAGLADAGSGLYLDFAWLSFGSEFRRRAQVADSAGTIRQYEYPAVRGTTPFLPIPTLAGSYAFGDKKQLTAAFGVFAPYTAIASYPLTFDGQPSPSRYSLVSLDGSALLTAGAYLAFKPVETIRIGLGLQALVGKFASSVVFNASPGDRLIGAPEQPEYDALSQLDAGPIIAPSGNLGVIASPNKHIRFGLSGQLPFWIDAPATVRVRLPTAAPFDRARQDGDESRIRFRLPPIVRAGVEYRTDLGEREHLRAELAYVHEFWSMHDTIDIRTDNVRLYDITGFPSPFGVSPISLPRNFQDSSSIRLGGELSTKSLLPDNQIDVRAGVSYETSAIPREWVSPLTYDANKVIASIGGSVHAGKSWRFDGVVSMTFLSGTEVAASEARIPRVNPVQGNPTATEAVNGGSYSASALILGVGIQYRF